jgi:hypothetical protein
MTGGHFSLGGYNQVRMAVVNTGTGILAAATGAVVTGRYRRILGWVAAGALCGLLLLWWRVRRDTVTGQVENGGGGNRPGAAAVAPGGGAPAATGSAPAAARLPGSCSIRRPPPCRTIRGRPITIRAA